MNALEFVIIAITGLMFFTVGLGLVALCLWAIKSTVRELYLGTQAIITGIQDAYKRITA